MTRKLDKRYAVICSLLAVASTLITVDAYGRGLFILAVFYAVLAVANLAVAISCAVRLWSMR